MAVTVALIDDEPFAKKMLHSAVQEAMPGADIHAFDDPQALLAFAAHHQIHIAFLDIQLREMTGTELDAHLQTLQPRINIIFCTAYDHYKGSAMDMHASGYLLKPILAEDIVRELEMLRFPLTEVAPEKKRLKAVCFGVFQALADGMPLRFRYSKTLEMLAVLIDWQGAMCSYDMIALRLWEDGTKHSSYMKRLTADLCTGLDKVRLGDILRRQKGFIGLDISRIDADYYDFLAGKASAIEAYNGFYMEQYPWAEETNAILYWRKEGE